MSREFEKVVPTIEGTHFENNDKTKEGLVRFEDNEGTGTTIFVDVFASSSGESSEVIASEIFNWNDTGATEASRFLQKHGFLVVVMLE